MKICYVVPVEYSSRLGIGGGARVYNMIKALKKLGSTISILSVVPAQLFLSSGQKFSFRNQGFNHVDNHVNAEVVYYYKDIHFLKSMHLAMNRLIKSALDSDVVIAQGPLFTTGFLSLLSRKRYRKSLIIDYIDVNHPIMGFMPRFLEPHSLVEDYVLRTCDYILTISHFLQKRVLSYKPPYRVFYLPAFVDINMFKVDETMGKETRERYGLGDDPVVLYAGSFWSVEGLPYLIKAADLVIREMPHVKFLIVGGGFASGRDHPLGQVKRLGIHKNVIFTGLVPYHEMPHILSATNIAVAPKISCIINEAAFPIKVVEYMATGLPVVATPVGDIKHIIIDNMNGILAKPENCKDLADKILRVLEDDRLGRRLSTNARKTVEKNFSINSASETLRLLLLKSLSNVS